MVVKNLGTWTAGSGIAHAPEIILGADTGKTVRINADFFQPDLFGLAILIVNRDPEPCGRNAQHTGQKLPRELNGLTLEIVPEAEIAQHLEEGVMPCSVADILKIVMFATGTNATLRGGSSDIRAILTPQKDILELHHPCIGK